MGDIISYVYEFGGFTFTEKPFCEIDGLVFSHLSYFIFDGIVPKIDENMQGGAGAAGPDMSNMNGAEQPQDAGAADDVVDGDYREV